MYYLLSAKNTKMKVILPYPSGTNMVDRSAVEWEISEVYDRMVWEVPGR